MQLTWCRPFGSPLHGPHIHNSLWAAVALTGLRVLFGLRILLLPLRLSLGQYAVRDGWVHCVADDGCRMCDDEATS